MTLKLVATVFGSLAVALTIPACDAGQSRGQSTTSTKQSGVQSTTSDGCPIDLVGFASLNAMGQDGTSGGSAGPTVTVATLADLKQYATATTPYVVLVAGTITFKPFEEIRVQSDKSIIGVGATGEIVNGGFFLGTGVHNVIIRNLTIRDSYVEGDWDGKTQDNDGVQMDAAHHVWIDHCRMSRIGDGMIDSRLDSTYETISWNIFENHNKTFGIGWTANVSTQLTIHHNWLRNTNQRNPSADNVLRAHLYNNFLERVASYGNHARGATHMVLENSVFDTVNNPHYYEGGSLMAIGNLYRNTSGRQESSGTAYGAFDPHDFYPYALDSADQLEALLARCAGPRSGLGR